MSAPKFTIFDSVLTPDGLGRIAEFGEGGDDRTMAKVRLTAGSARWYDIDEITHAL